MVVTDAYRAVRTLVVVAAALVAPAVAQEPPQYQVIHVPYRILDRAGRPLAHAQLAAKLDPSDAQQLPERTLRARVGGDEYLYSLDDERYTIFSELQTSKSDGLVDLPVIVYANRPDDYIAYQLNCLYGATRTNQVYPDRRKVWYKAADAGKQRTLYLDVVGEVPVTNWLIGTVAWLGATLMGALLFFRGVYPRMLAGGHSIDHSRALCWSGALFVSLAALALFYWLFLPQVINLYLFLGFLLVVWFVHMLVTVVPSHTQSHSV